MTSPLSELRSGPLVDAVVAGEEEVSLLHFDQRHDSGGFPSCVMSESPWLLAFTAALCRV